MSQRPFGTSLPLLGYACFVAALFLLVRGYQFNTNDQAEHLPQIYQLLDAELYPVDYFVNATNSIFTVRYYYEHFVLVVSKTIGLEWGLFVLTFLCIALIAYSFARIADKLFANRWSVLLAPVFAIIVFYGFTVGGNHVMYGSFISSTVAKSISAFALLQFVRSRMVFAGIILGIAALFQPLVGLQLFLILTGIELLVRRNLKLTVSLIASFLAIAMFILVPVFFRQFAEGVLFDKELYYEILYRFRNHHHYLPSLFPTTHYIKFGGLLVLGLISYFLVKPNDKEFYPGLVGFGLLGMLVYWVGLEHLNIHQLGKVQWFKITVWIGAFSSIMIAGFVGQFLSGFIPLTQLRKHLFPSSFFLSICLLFSITNSKFLPEAYQHKYMVGNRVYSDLENMHFWIEKNTDLDVSVLISPDNNLFPCQAKRSVPIHFQAIIHEPFFMMPWYDDYMEIYGVSIENLEGIDARKAAVDKFHTRNYRGVRKHIDYRLDNLETCQFVDELGSIIHQEGSWVLTEFKSVNTI
jgi:MFS family permease